MIQKINSQRQEEMGMVLHDNVISDTKPKSTEEILTYFSDDERIIGKKLKFYDVQLDRLGTKMDSYTNNRNVKANHYDIYAVFE
jgi:hypothetical protein